MSDTETTRYLNPSSLPEPSGYSQVVVAGPGQTVYISGQIALDAEGRMVGEGDFRAQAEQVFLNLQSAMQEAGDGDLSNIVKLTAFVTDMSVLPIYREVRDRLIGRGPRPASTVVQVSALFRPGFLIEIEAVGLIRG